MSRHTRIITTLILGIGMMAMTSIIKAQTTYYVDDDAPCDPGPGDPGVSSAFEDGSATYPFDAIQEGLDAADGGDTVMVKDGIYSGAGIYFTNWSSHPDMTNTQITGNYAFNRGGGIYCAFGDHDISHCTISENYAGSLGGGVFIYGDVSSITDSEICYSDGAGIYCSSGTPLIENCLIAGSGDSGIHCVNSQPVLER